MFSKAELYRADFEAERSARESLHQEKEQFKAKCDKLRSQNAQLQQELQTGTALQLEHMQQRHATQKYRPGAAGKPLQGVMGPPGDMGTYRPAFETVTGSPAIWEGGNEAAAAGNAQRGVGEFFGTLCSQIRCPCVIGMSAVRWHVLFSSHHKCVRSAALAVVWSSPMKTL